MKLLGCCALILAASSASAAAQEAGAISGRLLDFHNIPSGAAVVFVCDANSGIPLLKESYRPLGSEGESIQGFDGLAHAVTNAEGRFALQSVPVGKYRLVAQSWAGFAGLPDRKDPGEKVFLHGVKNDVEVSAAEMVEVSVEPLGAASMMLENDPQEEHALLVLSTAPMRGDPVLPFYFWGERFARHAIGVTLMETHKVTFHGLPEGELHAGLFNYDNNPGVGGATFMVVDCGTARIPIYATWSNGKYDPPETLLPLVEHLENSKLTATELLKTRFPGEFEVKIKNRNPAFDALLKHGDEMLTVEGFGEVRILDLAAADSYRRLREHHKQRREQANREESAGEDDDEDE